MLFNILTDSGKKKNSLYQKKCSSYNGKSVTYMLRAFLFYSFLRRQAFFFHTAITLAYQLFFPFNSLKRRILVSEKRLTKVMRKAISSDCLPRGSLAFSLLQLLFLEVYIMSTEVQEHFSGSDCVLGPFHCPLK